jgi:hypothetical protein
MSVTYTATLTVREETVLSVSGLLNTERLRRGTRTGTRALTCFKQVVLVVRWLLDNTRLVQLAADNPIGRSTAYAHLLATDRCRASGPTPGVDLWWSGKHDQHGGNVQVVPAPDGWPLWSSPVRPGREHDTTALRMHTEVLPLLTTWTAEDLAVLGDLGYEGEADTIAVAIKKPKNGQLTDAQKAYNKAHNSKRAIGERGNSLLKTTFKALRNVSLCPCKIGTIVVAAHPRGARRSRRSVPGVTAPARRAAR